MIGHGVENLETFFRLQINTSALDISVQQKSVFNGLTTELTHIKDMGETVKALICAEEITLRLNNESHGDFRQ